jgi:hypothetical protein
MRSELGGATSGRRDLVPLASTSRRTTPDARTMKHHHPVVRVDGPCRPEQHPQPGRVDKADSGQVEQRRHSVRSRGVEGRAQAVSGTPVEFAAGSYEASLVERLARDSEKTKGTHPNRQFELVEAQLPFGTVGSLTAPRPR